MKVNISDIVKSDGASLSLDICETIADLNTITDGFLFDSSVAFKGRLVNVSGILKLTGKLKADYKTRCFRCLAELDETISADIKEDFIDREKDTDGEAYTYEGNFIDISKVLQDNIILNLPVRQICSDNCKGLCKLCGTNLNEKSCECREEEFDPRMQVLHDFFDK